MNKLVDMIKHAFHPKYKVGMTVMVARDVSSKAHVFEKGSLVKITNNQFGVYDIVDINDNAKWMTDCSESDFQITQ